MAEAKKPNILVIFGDDMKEARREAEQQKK